MSANKHILITGGTGFIGQQLIPVLIQQGHHITVWGRDAVKIKRLFTAGIEAVEHLQQIKQPVDVIINLAGASIGEGRWTQSRKQTLISSREHTTFALFEWAKGQKNRPVRLINGSAVGYYGIDAKKQWAQVCDEDSAGQHIFMSELCQRWEAAADQFKTLGIEVVKLRLAVVLGQGGGILKQLLQPIKYAKIGKIGSGKQPFSWVHIDDVIAVVLWLMQQQAWHSDVYNVVAPESSTQADFVAAAEAALQIKAGFSLPASLMVLLMGEQADLVINGQQVVPKRLLEHGFVFQYPTLKSTLMTLI